MNEHRLEELTNACKKSKDPRVITRALAVRMVLVNHTSIEDAAKYTVSDTTWVRRWVKRFEEKGVEGLSDLPRSGAPHKVKPEIIRKIINDKLPRSMRPVEVQQEIRQVTGVCYHIRHVRNMMHQFGLSRKRATGLHINHASEEEVSFWQSTINQRISRLIGQGFTVLLEDESFFGRDGWKGQGGWTPIGQPHTVPYVGDYKTIAVMGAFSLDRQQMFRTADKVNAPIFSSFLLEMCREFGPVAVILDRSRVHTSKDVAQTVKDNPDIRLIFLPKGSPQLNAIEEIWHQSKDEVLVSKYYSSRGELKQTLSEFLRTTRFRLDPETFLHREPLVTGQNFIP